MRSNDDVSWSLIIVQDAHPLQLPHYQLGLEVVAGQSQYGSGMSVSRRAIESNTVVLQEAQRLQFVLST
jgi:hypothetical protein